MNYLNRLIQVQTLASQRFAGARLAVWASGCGDLCTSVANLEFYARVGQLDKIYFSIPQA
jgi:hypothetical protein